MAHVISKKSLSTSCLREPPYIPCQRGFVARSYKDTETDLEGFVRKLLFRNTSTEARAATTKRVTWVASERARAKELGKGSGHMSCNSWSTQGFQKPSIEE